MRVAVLLGDKTVSVDGLAIQIAPSKFPQPENINGAPAANASVISWHGDALMGTVQGGEPFRDPAVVRPYVRAWSEAVADMAERVGKSLDAEEVAYQAHLAAEAAAHKERQRVAAMSDEDRAREAAAGPK